MLITLAVFLIILSVLVLIHELGHFLVAKKLGIKVEEFGFGFPPRVWGIKRGETLYSVNALPIGGFVKLYGEDEAGAGKIKIKDQRLKIKDTDRAFFSRPVGQRAAVVVAGVLMNVLLAIAIYYIFLFISGFRTQLPLLGDHKFFGVEQQNKSEIIINNVAKDSPADKAGIAPFSVVESINGQKITSVDILVDIIKKNKGKEVTLVWKDTQTNKREKAVLAPRINPPKNQGALGISFFPATTATLNYNTPTQKIFSGIIHPLNLLSYNFDVIGKLIAVSIQQKTAAPLGDTVAGPVGIYSLVGTIVQIPDLKERILQVLNLAGTLSISLAFMNILPIPALDGGRLFFILIEAMVGRKVNQKFENIAHAIGMAVLLTLILMITFKDILKLLP